MTTTMDKQVVTVSAGEMAYVERGEGKPVLLLHGFPTSSYLWRHVLPPLASWFRVVAPDLIGAGDSAKPGDRPLDLVAQAGYVGELLDTLEIGECAVVGHGMGGGIAQLLVLEGRVRAAVLVDSFAFDRVPDGAERLLALDESERSPARVLGLIGVGFEAGMGHPERLTDDDLQEYERPFTGREGARAYFRLAQALRPTGLAGREGELAAREIPMLLFWGEDDPFLPPDIGEQLHDAMTMSSFATLPGCSHYLPEDAPETIGPLIFEWLRTKYEGRSSHEHGVAASEPLMISIGRRPPEPPPVGFEDLEEEEEE